MTTATVYAEFAARETRGISPIYERLSVSVSRDDEVGGNRATRGRACPGVSLGHEPGRSR